MLICRDYTHSIVVKQADRKKTALLKKGKGEQAAGALKLKQYSVLNNP